jgi:hypothetical protein
MFFEIVPLQTPAEAHEKSCIEKEVSRKKDGKKDVLEEGQGSHENSSYLECPSLTSTTPHPGPPHRRIEKTD